MTIGVCDKAKLYYQEVPILPRYTIQGFSFQ